MKRQILLITIIISILLMASFTSAAPHDTTTATITPEDGGLLDAGDVTLLFQPNAVDEPLVVTLSEEDVEINTKHFKPVKVFKANPHGSNFNIPGTLTFRYNPSKFDNEENIVVGYVKDAEEGIIEPLNMEQDTKKNTISFEVPHFSTFAVGEATPTDPATCTDCEYTIHLKSRTFVPGDKFISKEIADSTAGVQYMIVQFYEDLHWWDKSLISKMGYRFDVYLPNNAYLMKYTKNYNDEFDTLPALFIKDPRVRAIITIEPQDKMSLDIYNYAKDIFTVPKEYVNKDGTINAEIEFADRANIDDTVVPTIQTQFGKDSVLDFQSAWPKTVLFQGTPDEVKKLAETDLFERDIRFVGLRAPESAFSLAWDTAKITIGQPEIETTYPSLDGNGISIGQLERTRPNTENSNLIGQVTEIAPEPTTDDSALIDHATMVASILAGTDTFGEQYTGMVQGAQILSAGLLPLDTNTLRQSTTLMLRTGVDVVNSAWIYGLDGQYLTTGAEIDRDIVVWRKPFVLAASDDRGTAFCNGDYNYQFECLRTSATAKNAIVVGSSLSDIDTMWSQSSPGPTIDGRLKPDLVAPGCGTGSFITAPGNDNQLSNLCASSLSVPQVSGTIALMAQARADQSGSRLFPSTYKAILANTATDIGATGPDFESGFGMLNAFDAVEFVVENPPVSFSQPSRIVERTVTSDQRFGVYTIENVMPGETLKVTLAWDDIPATTITNRALVHDLDLEVIDEKGRIHKPLGAANPINGELPDAFERKDYINNIEQVAFEAPADIVTGRFEVRVRAPRLSGGSQTYSLVSNHQMDWWQCITPPFEDAIIGGEILFCPGTYYIDDTAGSQPGIYQVGDESSFGTILSCMDTQFIGEGQEGIRINTDQGKVYGCGLQGYRSGIVVNGITAGGTTGNTVDGAVIANNHLQEIDVYGISSHLGSTNKWVYGNQIEGIASDSPPMYRRGIILRSGDTASHNTITTMRDGIVSGSLVNGGSQTFLTITNNLIQNVVGRGIFLNNARNSIITKNTIEDPGQEGIRIGSGTGSPDASDGYLVADNTIVRASLGIYLEGSIYGSGSIPGASTFRNNFVCFRTSPYGSDISLAEDSEATWQGMNNICDDGPSSIPDACSQVCPADPGTAPAIFVYPGSEFVDGFSQPVGADVTFHMYSTNILRGRPLSWSLGEGIGVGMASQHPTFVDNPTATYSTVGDYAIAFTVDGIRNIPAAITMFLLEITSDNFPVINYLYSDPPEDTPLNEPVLIAYSVTPGNIPTTAWIDVYFSTDTINFILVDTIPDLEIGIGAEVYYTPDTQGLYVFELNALDGTGTLVQNSVGLSAYAVPIIEYFYYSDDSVPTGESITFSSLVFEGDGPTTALLEIWDSTNEDIIIYSEYFEVGVPVEIDYTFEVEGEYVAQVIAEDAYLAIPSELLYIVIEPGILDVTASSGAPENSGNNILTFPFDVNIIYGSSYPESVTWSFSAADVNTGATTGDGETGSVSYATPGDYTLTVTVTDEYGTIYQDSIIVTVPDYQPTMSDVVFDPPELTQCAPLTFDTITAIMEEQGNAPQEYTWAAIATSGSGEDVIVTTDGFVVTDFIIPTIGTYDFSVTVVDGNGDTAQSPIYELNVNMCGGPPTGNAGEPSPPEEPGPPPGVPADPPANPRGNPPQNPRGGNGNNP